MQISMRQFADHIIRVCPKPRVIVEVGSHDGVDSAYLHARFPEARCIAIEGDPANFPAVRDRNDVEPVLAVIGKQDGICLWYRQSAPMISGMYDRGLPHAEVLQLPMRSLASVCLERDIPYIDVLRIDAEGATLDVLEGCGALLDGIQIMHLETETYPYFKGQRLHDEVVAFLEARGWRCELLEVGGDYVPPEGVQYDSIWVRA